MALIILAVFSALLGIYMQFLEAEIDALENEQGFLAGKLEQIKKDRGALNEELGKALISRTCVARVTAYSSTPDQTDDTPFITAYGTPVYDGVVASNFLPFKTKIRLPEVFGEKVFTVEDRMKRNDSVDIWFKTREAALVFGVRNLQVEILNN